MDTSFVLFCVLASVNHSVSYVATFFSSSLLPAKLASISLGLLWGSNAVAGLFLASSLTQFLGLRGSLIVSFAGYALQIGCLYLSIAFPTYAWALSITGSVLAGTTSAIWWDCQALVVESASASSASSTDSISSRRSSNNALWTLIYQGLNMAIFLSLTLLQYGGASLESLLQSLLLAAVASTAWIAVLPLGPKGQSEAKTNADDPKRGFSQVLLLFATDYRCSLLAPSQAAFGIATALFAYFVNADLISGAAGDDDASVGILYLGVLESFAYLVSALAAYPYSHLVRRYNALNKRASCPSRTIASTRAGTASSSSASAARASAAAATRLQTEIGEELPLHSCGTGQGWAEGAQVDEMRSCKRCKAADEGKCHGVQCQVKAHTHARAHAVVGPDLVGTGMEVVGGARGCMRLHDRRGQ